MSNLMNPNQNQNKSMNPNQNQNKSIQAVLSHMGNVSQRDLYFVCQTDGLGYGKPQNWETTNLDQYGNISVGGTGLT